jgi:hypothetical protein
MNEAIHMFQFFQGQLQVALYDLQATPLDSMLAAKHKKDSTTDQLLQNCGTTQVDII